MKRPLAVVMGALVLATGACTKGEVEPLPPPPSVPITTSTLVVDYSAIGLAGVPGRTTTTLAMGPGKATIAGQVVGPDGPVAGAVVRAERLVGEGQASIDFLTDADGKFALPQILGGRYRVRAWKAAPDNLALVEPQVFFLEGSESKVANIALNRYQGAAVTAAIAPDPPLIATASNLVVQVVNREVDANGVVQSTAVPGARAELFGSGDWRILTANPTTTDESGRARWQLECRRVGGQPLSVVVGETATFNLNLPACTVPPPIEEADPSATTTAPAAPTTTARPTTTVRSTPTTR